MSSCASRMMASWKLIWSVCMFSFGIEWVIFGWCYGGWCDFQTRCTELTDIEG